MKFMLMMQGTQAGWQALSSWSATDFKAHVEFMIGIGRELTESGELVLAEGLDLPQNAKIVRALDVGAPTVSDGPFAEAKEFLAGFWIVDVATPQRAIEIAAEISTAPGKAGAPLGIPVEVRQVGSAPDV
jgi:hypothetical protein